MSSGDEREDELMDDYLAQHLPNGPARTAADERVAQRRRDEQQAPGYQPTEAEQLEQTEQAAINGYTARFFPRAAGRQA